MVKMDIWPTIIPEPENFGCNRFAIDFMSIKPTDERMMVKNNTIFNSCIDNFCDALIYFILIITILTKILKI